MGPYVARQPASRGDLVPAARHRSRAARILRLSGGLDVLGPGRCAECPLRSRNFPHDFPQEAGQLDGTLAHCLERLLVLASRQQGYCNAVIEDASAELVGMAPRPLLFSHVAGRRGIFRRSQTAGHRVRHFRHLVVPPPVGPGGQQRDRGAARRGRHGRSVSAAPVQGGGRRSPTSRPGRRAQSGLRGVRQTERLVSRGIEFAAASRRGSRMALARSAPTACRCCGPPAKRASA